MGEVLWTICCIAFGLVLGWIFLPEPKIVRDFFVKIGWAKPLPLPPPQPPGSVP